MSDFRVVVVDDHAILRDGIVSILNAQPDFEVVAVADSMASALKVVRDELPDLVLMDYGLPDGTGLEATRQLLELFPQIKIVLLTVHEEDDLLFDAIRSGAKGYLLKNISAQNMLAKLRGLDKGDMALLPDQTNRILNEFAQTKSVSTPDEDVAVLTLRELEVLGLIVNGASNQEIGSRLNISVYTVKNHVHNIIDKLGVNNRREAAKVAIKRKLLGS